MPETLTHSSTGSEAPSGIQAEALRAEAWAGEPFMRPDEDAAVVLAPGTAFRREFGCSPSEVRKDAGRRMPREMSKNPKV